MALKNNVLFILNPTAGNSDVNLLKDKVKDVCEKNSLAFEIMETSGDNDQKRIADKVKGANFDRVVVAGGDGTINLAASVLKDAGVSMGIIPTGSANGLALNLNLPDALEDQIKVALGETTYAMDILVVNGEDCLHVADLGLNAELIRNYDSSSIHGKLGYILQSIPTLFKADYPYHFEITIDGNSKKFKGILLAIANAPKFGMGATINPNGKMNDGKFEVIIFKKLNFFQILKTFTNGYQLKSEFAERFSIDAVHIKCKKPIALQIDGEYFGEQTDIEVKMLPGAIEIAAQENNEFFV